MSFFGKLFGGKKKDKPPTPKEAIQKLQNTEDMLIERQQLLENQIQLEIENIKKNALKNKKVAIQALKRKKRCTMQLKEINETMKIIEMQREVVEGTITNIAVVTSMRDAEDALNNANKYMNVDQIADMMNDISEQKDVAREICNATGHSVHTFGTSYIDEDDLERELEKLEQESLENELRKLESESLTTKEVPISQELNRPKAPKRKQQEKKLEMMAT